ncbi:HIT family protein [Vagococcus intermedius]|uniref:HIT family protein n=1 Tax=Vagococcus intermedius TaxID=2991418 RepID=A0AAF0I9N4_9ENTE|nr:HIT family protein [Vagococcus intermedius]WEG73607.1 HIT family protein [Vagococcus intermedius]WEG75691.1 HIT family protein [Vagococcus intermedius]
MGYCLFCAKTSAILLENKTCLAFYDKFPVSEGHLLIIPKIHRQDYFDLTPREQQDMADLLGQAKILLDKKFQPAGYNIGLNCGEVAGQTIYHCHCHVIPRYKGDCEQPKGGVRGVIPNKMAY